MPPSVDPAIISGKYKKGGSVEAKERNTLPTWPPYGWTEIQVGKSNSTTLYQN